MKKNLSLFVLVLLLGAAAYGDSRFEKSWFQSEPTLFREGNTVELVQRVTGSDTSTRDYFGETFALSGDFLAVGSHDAFCYSDPECFAVGAVHLFERDSGGSDNWGEVTKLVPSNDVAGDGFAESIAIDEDTIVVGAGFDDEAGLDAGAFYIFERNEGGASNWGEVAKMTASDPSASAYFGRAVAIQNNTIAVMASGANALYVFERNQNGDWQEVEKLTHESDFSPSIALDNDTLVVGTLDRRALVFNRDQGGPENWGLSDEIYRASSLPLIPNSVFGLSVEISGDTILITDYEDDTGCPPDSEIPDAPGDCNWGALHVYEVQEGIWRNTEFISGTQIGGAWWRGATTDGDHIVVGNPGLIFGNPAPQGEARLFARSEGGEWLDRGTIGSGELGLESGDFFGWEVSIESGTLVVGAIGDDDLGTFAGSAYIFDLVTGSENGIFADGFESGDLSRWSE